MQRHRLDIDGLRAFAIVPVVLFHMGFAFVPAGFLGVDVFFVISGFLITGILFKELEVTGKINFLKFYERRIRRIFPGFLLVLMVTLLSSWFILLPNDFNELKTSSLFAMVSLSNFYFLGASNYFSPDTSMFPLLHTWSLAVEEQFYLLFPLILLLIFKLAPRKLLDFCLVALLVASLAIAQVQIKVEPEEAFYLIQFRAWELIAGALASISIARLRVSDFLANILSFIGLISVACSYVVLAKGFQHPSLDTAVPILGTVLVLLYSRPGNLAYRFLSRKLFVLIGLLSYSLYLWHQPIFAMARVLDESEMTPIRLIPWLGLVGVLSFFSWKFVENKFRNREKMSTKSVLKFAGSSSIAVLLATFFVQLPAASYASYSIGSAHTVTVAQLEDRLSPNYGVNRICYAFLEHQSTCTSGTNQGKPTVALWGDSFAMHIVQALQKSPTKARFIAQTMITCNPIVGIAPKNNANKMAGAAKCNRTNKAFFDYLLSSKAKSSIRTVILASHWENITLNGKTTLDSKGTLSNDPNKPRTALRETIAKLKSAGYRVVVISSPAYISANTGDCLKKAVIRRTAISKCDFPETSSLSIAPNTLLQSLVSGVDRYINLTRLMCPNSVCRASIGGTLIFRDKYHISREGSSYLGRTYDLMGLALRQE